MYFNYSLKTRVKTFSKIFCLKTSHEETLKKERLSSIFLIYTNQLCIIQHSLVLSFPFFKVFKTPWYSRPDSTPG